MKVFEFQCKIKFLKDVEYQNVYEKTKLLPLDLLTKFYEKFGFNEIYNEPEGNLMIKKYK